MKKKIVVIALMILLFATPVQADTIGGIEFDIPEEWTLEQSDENDDLAQNTYTCDNQAVMITVVPIDSTIGSNAYNVYVYDCDTVFGDKDGYYLMTDIKEKDENDNLSLVQECVYGSESDWFYATIVGKNNGESVISMVYTAASAEAHSETNNFWTIVNEKVIGG